MVLLSKARNPKTAPLVPHRGLPTAPCMVQYVHLNVCGQCVDGLNADKSPLEQINLFSSFCVGDHRGVVGIF